VLAYFIVYEVVSEMWVQIWILVLIYTRGMCTCSFQHISFITIDMYGILLIGVNTDAGISLWRKRGFFFYTVPVSPIYSYKFSN
jgi:hypothetical protein